MHTLQEILTEPQTMYDGGLVSMQDGGEIVKKTFHFRNPKDKRMIQIPGYEHQNGMVELEYDPPEDFEEYNPVKPELFKPDIAPGGGDEGQHSFSYPGANEPGHFEALDTAFDSINATGLNSMADINAAIAAAYDAYGVNLTAEDIQNSITGRAWGALAFNVLAPSLLSTYMTVTGKLNVPTHAQFAMAMAMPAINDPLGIHSFDPGFGDVGRGPVESDKASVFDHMMDFPGDLVGIEDWGSEHAGDITGGMESDMGSLGVTGFASAGETDPSGAGEGHGTEGYYAYGGQVSSKDIPENIRDSLSVIVDSTRDLTDDFSKDVSISKVLSQITKFVSKDMIDYFNRNKVQDFKPMYDGGLV